jgi:hypothetical protein
MSRSSSARPRLVRREPASFSPPLLVPRDEARRLLGGISLTTIARLEALGVLTPRKLYPNTPNGKTYYDRDELIAVAKGGNVDD